MGHQLKRLLGNDHPLFVSNMFALERAVGNDGVDTRLLGDIFTKGYKTLHSLGLDPQNTTPLEAYRALQNLVGSNAVHDILKDTDYVILALDDELVSFNKYDILKNADEKRAFADRHIDAGQRSLRLEVVKRYADHDRSENSLVHRLAEEIGLAHVGELKLPDEIPPPPKPIEEPKSEQLHKKEEGRKMEESHNKKPHVLAIGDIFTDAFIQLSEDSATVTTAEDGTKLLSLPFGAKPSYDHVDIVESVGPSPNVAVSLARLGVDVSLMAWLGDDQPGKDSLKHLKEENVGTDTMVTQPGAKSSYWYVLRYGADRTMLVKSEAYDYKWVDPAKKPDWIYLSYIGEDSWPLHEQLLEYLDRNPDIKLVFQPGTFHYKWGKEKLAAIYKRSYMTLMNREEAMDVTGQPYEPLRGLANGLHDLGPHVVVVTDGPNGSYASYDYKFVTIPNYPDPQPPLDRTGAGDAFASTILAGLVLGEGMDTAMTWAPINSMNVVQHMGAQAGLLTKDKLLEFLANAPDDYKLSEVQE
jgi:sugar/nucleoside kinase (ribokinase family)